MKLASLLVGIAFAATVVAQDAPKVKLNLPDKIAPGKTIKGSVTVTFTEGWHGYQNPPLDSSQIPVALSMKAKYVKLGKISYPVGIIKDFAGIRTAVYEGTITIPFEIVAPKKAQILAMAFTLNYQQCNDSSCLHPGSLQYKGTVKVAK